MLIYHDDTYEGVRPFCCIASKRPTATAVVAKGQVKFRCNTAERVRGECTSVSVPGGHSARRLGHVSSTAVPQSLSKHFCLQLGAQQSLVACVTFFASATSPFLHLHCLHRQLCLAPPKKHELRTSGWEPFAFWACCFPCVSATFCV